MGWIGTSLFLLRFPILVFVLNVILDARGLYYMLPWIDMPMHFLGGASIAVAGISFLAFSKMKGFVNELPFLARALFIMSFVGLAAASWELWEFSIDRMFKGNLQGDLPDTMADMFFGLLGGLATSIVWLCLRGKARS